MSPSLPSIHDDASTEQGGPLARKGFTFQDHVAAQCCLEMIEDAKISEVWCETYDDVVNIKSENNDSAESVEYVQVKSLEIGQLWSVAQLCRREGKKPSLLEGNLSKNRFSEPATFRIVTSLPVNKDLQLLQLPLLHKDRHPTNPAFIALADEVQKTLRDPSCAPGTNTAFWLMNALWQNHVPASIRDSNLTQMHRALHQLGYNPDPTTCNDVYQQLLVTVKEAAELPWAHRQQRKFPRKRLIDLLHHWADPHPNLGNTQRLVTKIEATTLDSSYTLTAQHLRATFRNRFRDSRVMEELDRSDVQTTVMAHLQSLRLQLDSGELDDTPAQFYNRCVNAMMALRVENRFAKLDLPEGFFEGCMYEIVGRCAHRFRKGGQ